MASRTTSRWIGAAVLTMAGIASAAVPPSLTQQGRILDKDGAAVSSKIAIVFTIYNDPSASEAANVLWTETQNITLDDGYFSTQLGEDVKNAFDAKVFDGSVRYLGVKVGSDDEMAPRQKITSVPYAFSANLADLAATAQAVPWMGITGMPAACPDGQYLKGFDNKGVPQCTKLPALSCTTVAGAKTATDQQVGIGCSVAGQFLVGGGCDTSGTLMKAGIWNVCVLDGIISAGPASPIGSAGPVSQAI